MIGPSYLADFASVSHGFCCVGLIRIGQGGNENLGLLPVRTDLMRVAELGMGVLADVPDWQLGENCWGAGKHSD